MGHEQWYKIGGRYALAGTYHIALLCFFLVVKNTAVGESLKTLNTQSVPNMSCSMDKRNGPLGFMSVTRLFLPG